MVLRDNQTSQEHPDGIYHPHADVQHIKKENIGLIEVMGLAILPPRLKEELKQVELFLLGEDCQLQPIIRSGPISSKTRLQMLPLRQWKEYSGIGWTNFQRVLEDAGVYKRTEEGQEAFMRFVQSVGIQP